MVSVLQQTEQQRRYTFEELNILKTVITLWMNYAMWTRSLLVSTVFNLPEGPAIRKRLYELPADFYSTLRVFFGNRIAQQFLDYFQRYILIQIQLIEALTNNNQAAADTYTQELYKTADEIALFLGQFPYWNETQWKQYLYADINASLDEARAFMAGDYEREISIYDRIMLNAQDIGEYMTRGILGDLT